MAQEKKSEEVGADFVPVGGQLSLLNLSGVTVRRVLPILMVKCKTGYGQRGANPRYMREFNSIFPGATVLGGGCEQ